MKSKYSVLLSLVLIMPLALSAASKNSAKMTLTIRSHWWNAGACGQLSRSVGRNRNIGHRQNYERGQRHRKCPPTLVHVKSPYSDEAVSVGPGDNNSKVLQAIEWSHQSLQFDQTGGSLASTAGNTKK